MGHQVRELEGQLAEAKAREQERTAASEAAAATAEAALKEAEVTHAAHTLQLTAQVGGLLFSPLQ
jgi:hypothetical protein